MRARTVFGLTLLACSIQGCDNSEPQAPRDSDKLSISRGAPGASDAESQDLAEPTAQEPSEPGAEPDDDSSKDPQDEPDEERDWSCLAPLPRASDGACTPAYEPTFENVFSNTLSKRCAFSSCHSAQVKAGGLVFGGSVEDAFLGLTQPPEDEPWIQVIAENPECSPLMMRLESDDPSFAMPPRGPIQADERCAITQWIADGAPGPSP